MPGRARDPLLLREDVLEPIEALLKLPAEGGVVFLHGPAGTGKSALLGEIGRRALRQHRGVYQLDARRMTVSAEALMTACSATELDRRPVLLIDSFERIDTLAAVLRDQILSSLAASAVVVVASRLRPAALWFRDGWEHVVREVELHPCTPPPGVRTALRAFHDPVALSANPLADGDDVAARAASVRARIRAAVDTAFGDTPTEQLLRRLIERGYLDDSGGHRQAMSEAHLARSSYFRRLDEAISRLDATIAGSD